MNTLSTLFQTGTGELGLTEFFVSVVFSLVVGVICMFLYRAYFSETYDRNESLNKSFIIIAPSISAVFWAIQYSLPLSLGLLGALSFVRFRTPIKRSEDIAFILLVIALALLSSVYRFWAAGLLLAVITLTVIVKKLLVDRRLPILGAVPLFSSGTSLTAFVSTHSKMVEKVDSDIRGAIRGKFSDERDSLLTLNDVVQKDPGYNLRYSLFFKDYNDTVIAKIIGTLNELDNLERVEVFHGKVS
jgi:hypothetical protein